MILKIKQYKEEFIVGLAILVYVIAACAVSLNRYWQFNAFWYELGLYNEAIWKVSRFQPPTIEQFDNKIIFADHFNPSLYLFSPVYWFTDRTEAILVTQAAAVGLSAWVAYLIGRKFLKRKIALFALLSAYLGFVGLQNALYTDFHDTTVATLFVILAFWAIFNRKWVWYFLFLLIVLGFKESMPGLGFGMGLYLIIRRDRNIKTGLLTILISTLWYFSAVKIIIPYFSGGIFAYEPIEYRDFQSAFSAFFIPLDLKARTIFLSLATFGFAPIFNLSLWPVIVEHYAERFVFSGAATRWDLGFHYNATISPLFFISSLSVFKFIEKRRFFTFCWSMLIIASVIFLHRFYLHGPLMLASHPVFYWETKNAKFMEDFFKTIPKNGLIMTQNNIAAHLSQYRVRLIDFKGFSRINPDIVALDLRGGQNANNFFPSNFDEASRLSHFLYLDSRYSKLEFTSDQLIFVKKR